MPLRTWDGFCHIRQHILPNTASGTVVFLEVAIYVTIEIIKVSNYTLKIIKYQMYALKILKLTLGQVIHWCDHLQEGSTKITNLGKASFISNSII